MNGAVERRARRNPGFCSLGSPCLTIRCSRESAWSPLPEGATSVVARYRHRRAVTRPNSQQLPHCGAPQRPGPRSSERRVVWDLGIDHAVAAQLRDLALVPGQMSGVSALRLRTLSPAVSGSSRAPLGERLRPDRRELFVGRPQLGARVWRPAVPIAPRFPGPRPRRSRYSSRSTGRPRLSSPHGSGDLSVELVWRRPATPVRRNVLGQGGWTDVVIVSRTIVRTGRKTIRPAPRCRT